jgi:soluble lytic murein transglycosylase-like protein
MWDHFPKGTIHMLPSMTFSQAPTSLFLLLGVVLTFAVIIVACSKGSRDRQAGCTSLPLWVIVALVVLAVLIYGRIGDVVSSEYGSLFSVSPHSQTTVHVAPAPTPSTRAYYIWYARQAATAVHINPDVFVRQIEVESDFNPSAVSRAGAIGIAQFMESTARAWGVDPYDPERSLTGAARLMAHLLSVYQGSYAKALGAYNAGEAAINAAIKRAGASWQGYIPLETRRYIQAILQGMSL